MRLLAAIVLLLSVGSALAQTGGMQRAKRWDFTLNAQQLDGKTYTSEGGAEARTDNSLGFGFGVQYNPDNHWSFGGEFNWNTIDYRATITPAAGNGMSAFQVNGSMETSTFAGVASYNFLTGPVTPFVSGMLGFTYVDTNIPNGPPANVCWYDPWYGYYCGTVVPTRADNYFSYGVGAGVRWDITREFFMRGSANYVWLDIGGAAGTPQFTVFRLDVGFRF